VPAYLVELDQVARSARPVAPPRSHVSSSPSRSLWQLHRLAAAALDSDELRRSPPLRWCPIGRSSDGDSTCPRDLVDCPPDARIPFTSKALDLGHGDLELDLELLGPVLGEIWCLASYVIRRRVVGD
jgi:hypothetical protein